MFVVDGKTISCIEDSAACQREIKRLQNFRGIRICPASNEAMIQFNVKTIVPYRIQIKMEEFYQEARKRACDLGY